MRKLRPIKLLDVKEVYLSKGWLISGKGLRISLGPSTIKILDDGTVESSGVPLLLGFDMCPHWIDISYSHLKAAMKMRSQIFKADPLCQDCCRLN